MIYPARVLPKGTQAGLGCHAGGSRILQGVALFLAVWLGAAGCSQEAGQAASPGKLVVALPQWFYPSAERPWLEHTWESIRQADPGVAIDLQLTPGRTEQILQKLLVARAGGEEPDLACVKMHWVRDLAENGMLVPLEGLVRDTLWSEVVPAIRSYGVKDDQHFLLPYDLGVRLILYRSDLFQQAGIAEPQDSWTWEDLAQDAVRLTVDRDGDGKVDQWGLGLPGGRNEKTVFQWLPLFWSLGGRLCEGALDPLAIQSPEAVRALQWYRDLAYRYRVSPPSFYSMDQESVFEGLAGGLFAMTVGGSWEPALLTKLSQHGGQIRIAQIPAPQPGARSVTLVDGWGFVVLSRDASKGRAIGRLLSELAGSEHQLQKYEGSRSLSPFQALYRDPAFQAHDRAGVLAEAVRRSRPLPECSSFPRIVEALVSALQEVLMRGTSPEEALAVQQKNLMARPLEASIGSRPGPGSSDRVLEERTADAPYAPDGREVPLAPSVPAVSIRVRVEGGEERVLSQEVLRTLHREPVGDLSLVPLAALSPAEGRLEIRIKAADGFEKSVPAEQWGSAFLDPETLRAVILRDGGKVFTVRDVVEVMFVPGPKAGGLALVAGTREFTWSAAELHSMANGGTVSFQRLLADKSVPLAAGGTVRLVAGDGYKRELPGDRFLEGRLRPEGMQCEIPGASSKDQVSDLIRVEVP